MQSLILIRVQTMKLFEERFLSRLRIGLENYSWPVAELENVSSCAAGCFRGGAAEAAGTNQAPTSQACAACAATTRAAELLSHKVANQLRSLTGHVTR